MLIGGFLQNVDIKGRIFVPSKFRADLGQRFYVYSSFDGCVRAYSEKEWQQFLLKLDSLPIDANQILRDICDSACEVETDTQGRAVIPEEVRRHANIDGQVKIIGMVHWIEFWNPDVAANQKSTSDKDETIRQLAAVGIR